MPDDRQAILDFYTTWMEASQRSDLETLWQLMAEDVVFLRAGHPPMIGRDAFATEFKSMPPGAKLKVEAWRHEEIRIEGNSAYCWNYLAITVIPPNSEMGRTMAGNILSVLRKNEEGRWVLARDANLLSPQLPAEA